MLKKVIMAYVLNRIRTIILFISKIVLYLTYTKMYVLAIRKNMYKNTDLHKYQFYKIL